MRYLLLFLMTTSLLNCSVRSQKNVVEDAFHETGTVTIYLVRHAEKESDGTNDPALNAAGKERAIQLSQILKNSNVKKIYSTDYQRTKMTARPLAKLVDKEIEMYSTEDEIAAALDAETGNVLVVGHSNTIPRLINRLVSKADLADLDEKEYDKLFVVSRKGDKYELLTRSY